MREHAPGGAGRARPARPAPAGSAATPCAAAAQAPRLRRFLPAWHGRRSAPAWPARPSRRRPAAHVGHPPRRRPGLPSLHRPRPGDVGQRQRAGLRLRRLAAGAGSASRAWPRRRSVSQHHGELPVRQHARRPRHAAPAASAQSVCQSRGRRSRCATGPRQPPMLAVVGHQPVAHRLLGGDLQRRVQAGAHHQPALRRRVWPNCAISWRRTSSVNQSAPGIGCGPAEFGRDDRLPPSPPSAWAGGDRRGPRPCGPAPSRAAPAPRREVERVVVVRRLRQRRQECRLGECRAGPAAC